MTDLIIDVPAFDVDDDDHGILGSDVLSVPDPTGSDYLVLEWSFQHFGVGRYGTGPNLVNLPVTPDGYTLTRATYVVTARRLGEETLVDPDDWSPDFPPPTSAPFLMIETPADLGNLTLDPIPDAYGDVEYAGNDLARILADTPCNRLWLQSYSNTPIYVSYLAVRLTYTSPDVPDATGELGDVRRRFTRAKP